jgi:nickel/cobalt transporter (NicO) family protein
MTEGLFYLVSSFWLGALHAATPGHGKTIAALASLGTAWSVPQRIEAYLAAGTGLLVMAIGLWMLRAQLVALALARAPGPAHPPPTHEHGDGPDHHHDDASKLHRHGWGPAHTHDLDRLTRTRPSLLVLLGLAVAGGVLPDPGALAILLAAIASGKLVLGLFTVVVFSVGFASVLVVVGVVAAHVGRLILTWLESRWIAWLQIGTALLILGIGVVLTLSAWRALAAVR